MRKTAGRGAALLLSLVVMAGAMMGCGGKYEEIPLPQKIEAGEESGSAAKDGGGSEPDTKESFSAGERTAGEETDGQKAAGDSSENSGGMLILEDADGAREADGAAVAGLSSLESGITTASGFVEVDETVFITEDKVNLRSGCGTEYGIVSQLNTGDSVKRTGYSEGWSRILYKDRTCYILSEFLSKEDPTGAQGENVAALENQPAAAAQGVGTASFNGRIVAIDAGHQAKGNSEKEPIGPGSSTMKAKVASGAEGISTKLPEYKLTLMVSQKVKRILEERGYQVVMIRETNDVNLSNAERAELANQSGASIFVRIHANSLDNGTVHGTLAMCQTSRNPYNGALHDKSYTLSKQITDGICAATGFKNRGVQETDTMSGINWCTIPVSIVEMGFMSNPEEDEKMAQDEYQELIAAGIANGIDSYFGF